MDDWAPCLVTGVVRDIPGNAHFSFDFLVPLKGFLDQRAMTIWGWQSFYTYIKLRPGSDIIAVDKKIRALVKKASLENKNYFYSQELTAIHLSSNLKSELPPNGDKTYIYIFGAVSLFILLIACINYINLTTANSALRAKEIGIRKVSGA